MTDGNNNYDDLAEELIADEGKAVAERIYRAHLPPYLQEPLQRGKGKGYEDFIREQLDSLVVSETCEDPERVTELKRLQNSVSLVLGIFGAAFRILDQIGMHLRGQTLGQYELLPEDEALLRKLCQDYSKARLRLSPFYGLDEAKLYNYLKEI